MPSFQPFVHLETGQGDLEEKKSAIFARKEMVEVIKSIMRTLLTDKNINDTLIVYQFFNILWKTNS